MRGYKEEVCQFFIFEVVISVFNFIESLFFSEAYDQLGKSLGYTY
jgi:hypothetical protein